MNRRGECFQLYAQVGARSPLDLPLQCALWVWHGAVTVRDHVHALLLAALATLVGACTAPAAGPPVPPYITVQVAFDAGTVPGLNVTWTIPRAVLPRRGTSLQLPFDEIATANGDADYGDFIMMQNGAPWPQQISLQFRSDGGDDTDLTLSFRVDLAHHRLDATYGIDEIPHPTSGGWLLVGRAFVPHIKVDGAAIDPLMAVRFELPESWLFTSSVHYLPQNAPAVLYGTAKQMRDALYCLGELTFRHLVFGPTSIDLVTADYDAEDLATLGDLVERTFAFASERLGRLGSGRRLLIYDRLPRGFAGGVIGDGIIVMSSTPPSERAGEAAGGMIIHELLHLWSKADALWLGEGFTRYFEIIAGIHIDAVDEQTAVERLLRIHERYAVAAAVEGTTIATADAYAAGAMLAFCLDTKLRSDASSLFAIYASARSRSVAIRESVLPAATFLAELERTAPDVRRYADRLLHHEGPIDIAACFTGYATREVEYAGYSMRALAVEVLGISSFSLQRPEIFSVRDGSQFMPGDIITSVAGQPIALISEVPWTLRELQPGDPVDAEVLRGGTWTSVRFVLPAVAAAQRPMVRKLIATPKPGETDNSPLRY